MDKSTALDFAEYKGLCPDVPYPWPDEPEVQIDSALKEVLDEIFSVDPVTGNPRGDIQYFMSKDGNPQVKAWLESNLLQPRRENPSYDGVDVTDDLIAEFSRKSGENVEAYASRLDGLRTEAMENYKKAQAELNQPSE